ncbi:MAG TPA: three-Cys-motif partner protein TcmP [Polyangia bacterium]|nr:three-Cys-motif partner protein TcmP [Polyangia bacterium]
MAPTRLQFDKIGYWSQIKLEIVKDYAKAYSTILAKQPRIRHVYIDAFAGAGIHELKSTGELVPGSPLNALNVKPPFRELHLVDLDGAKVENLRQLTAGRNDVFIYQGDTNEVLVREIFPRVRWDEYKRGLCLLDPYGLTLDWNVIAQAARARSIEIFLNFPMMDMNRNALWSDPAGVTKEDRQRMTAFWGDDSWQRVVYKAQRTLFGGEDHIKSVGNPEVVAAFRERLQNVAGFEEVPEPIPMRNKKNATVYYLFFASHNKTGAKIARHLLKRYAAAAV